MNPQVKYPPIDPSRSLPAFRPLPGIVRAPSLSTVAATMRRSRPESNNEMRKILAPPIPRIYSKNVPPLMNAEELESSELPVRLKNKKNEKDAARLVLFEDYYKKKKMEVRDTDTVQEQNKTRRVQMGAK